MLKEELEKRLGYEITDAGFEELNAMYMASSMNKDEFVCLIKQGAKVYKLNRPIKEIRYAKYPSYKTPNGCWYVGVKVGKLIDIDIKTGKIKVKFIRNAQIGDSDSYYGAQYSTDQIIELV